MSIVLTVMFILLLVILCGLVLSLIWLVVRRRTRSSMRAVGSRLLPYASESMARWAHPPYSVPEQRSSSAEPHYAPIPPEPVTDRIPPPEPDQPMHVVGPGMVAVLPNGVPAEPGPPPTASLRALRGSALDVMLTSSTVTIGRGTDRDILLDAGTVSRRHCTLRFRAGRWYVEDDRSPNGTFVNGTRLPDGAEVALQSGDRIGVGDDVLLMLTTSSVENQDLVLAVGAATDKGGRPRNEDALCATENVIAVADGVGGRPGGDVASGIAVSLARNASAGLPLVHLVPAMNAAITSRGHGDASLHNMATTFEGAQLITEVGGAVVRGVHIGDGCALLDDGNHIKTLTVPHTLGGRLAREGNPAAARHPDRARLLRVLGMPSVPEFDQWEERAVIGHRYVLSTDGILHAMSADELNDALVQLRDVRPERAARILVDVVLHSSSTARSRLDNMTVIIADVSQKVDNSRSDPSEGAHSPQRHAAIER